MHRLDQTTRRRYEDTRYDPLKVLASSTGLALPASHELSDLATLIHGGPVVVGPGHGFWDDNEIGGVREVGFAGSATILCRSCLPRPCCWVRCTGRTSTHRVRRQMKSSSARNVCGSVRRTSPRAQGPVSRWACGLPTQRWFQRPGIGLLSLVAISEPLGTGSDSIQPELVPVDYDHDAMVTYMRRATYSGLDE